MTWWKRREMWVYEQSVLGVLVATAAGAQVWTLLMAQTAAPKPPLAIVQQLLGIVLSALTTMVAQKVRSMADRKREVTERAGAPQYTIECHAAQARWGIALQVLGLFSSIALAPTVFHVPVGLFVALYEPLWRPYYRRCIRPLRGGW
jgi:hypothetical protein